MATKEDILEQLVEEYLLHRGYFVRHNLKYRPRRSHADFVSKNDSNHSDIDVIGYHPLRTGAERVVVVSCKSWQSGFDVLRELRHLAEDRKVRGRQAWQGFRELCVDKWSEAFLDCIDEHAGTREFTYILAVTRVIGDRKHWQTYAPFRRALGGNPIRILDLTEMLAEIAPSLGTTVAATEVGRMLQLLKAAGLSSSHRFS